MNSRACTPPSFKAFGDTLSFSNQAANFGVYKLRKMLLQVLLLFIATHMACSNPTDKGLPCCTGKKYDKDEDGITDGDFMENTYFSTYGDSLTDSLRYNLINNGMYDTFVDGDGCHICE